MTKLAWTPELEALWRARFEAMKNVETPFRPFITKISEIEWHDAFELCLNELERLRSEYVK
jgi:hypothetical protein